MTDKANNSIIDEYLSYVKLYESKYDKYLVLLMVGSFFEVYSIDPEDTKLKNVCELLNIILTRKNKSISKISKANPWMAGVPCCSLDKYLNVLIDNNYTVIVYIQEDLENSKKKGRKLDKIYSIGTNVNCEKDNNEENVILSIYRESIVNTPKEDSSYGQSRAQRCSNNILGISIINLATGNLDIVEIYNEDDMTKLLEDLNKIIIIYKPKEIIYNYINDANASKDQIYNMLNNNNKIFHHNVSYLKDYLKISYQNDFLKSIYKNHNMGFLNSIEYLNIEKYNHARVSLITLLNFIYKYDNMLIENINIPNILNNENIMNLHNNALEQLNVFSIIDKKSQVYKYNSLYDVINKNSTKLGMRLLKKMLAEPSTNVNELNKRYMIVDKLITSDIYKKYEIELKNIIDIEKYHKSLGINKLHPYQYGRLNNSYKALLKLINLSKCDFESYYEYSILDEFKEYYNEYKKYFNIDNLEVYSFTNKNNILLNIFNNGVVSEVDSIYNTIQLEKNKLDILVNGLSKLIDDNSKSSNIKIKNNDINGYFLELTKIRANKLKKIIDTDNIYQDLIFENKIKSSTYITSKSIKDISKNIIINENKLYNIMKESYYNITNDLYKKYYKLLVYLNYFVSHLDVFTSFAKVSILNNYSKPIINIESNKSYIDVKNIRHPIIELLSTSAEYVTNDISINKDNKSHNGVLLYGVNSSGKSSIMKALGLNLILAQIGCYTASSNFEYYPYNSIFTRIDHSDNIFKGYSSYEVEIMELKNILKYSNENSLVLGDELLSSTESISAISIISATINYFLTKNISFLFASHIFEIVDHIELSLKEKILVGHLKTLYDDKNKCFIYNRKLQKGLPNANYGLIVASSIIDSMDIIQSALQIQNKILNNNQELINNKKSRYNKKLIVDCCYICKDLNISKKLRLAHRGVRDAAPSNEVLETHHITEQKKFNNNKCIVEDKEHIKKNQLSNLVVLCAHHHDLTHNNKIIINGWVDTTNGIKLDYTIL